MASNSTGDWTLERVIVVGLWLSIIILIGMVGNILVIIVSVQGTKGRTRGKSLIVSLACADLLESVNMIFMLITAASRGKWILGDVMCALHGFANIIFIMASLYSLMAISINRYVIVVRSNQYNKIFSKRNLVFIIASIWVFPFFFAVPPLFGVPSFEHQPNKATCFFYFSSSKTFSIFFMIVCIPVPLGVVVFCCCKIFIQVRRHQRRVQSNTTTTNINAEEIRITNTLVIIIWAFLICFIPGLVVNYIEMADSQFKIPFWADIVTINLVLLNHANNPIIYGFCNRQYRQAFKQLVLRSQESNALQVS